MYSLRSTSIKAALGLVALLFSAAAAAQINPNQIAWPTGPTGCFYAPGTNTCASASGGSAVPQLVQFVQSSCGAGPCSLRFTNNVGPGNALIYECQHGVAGNCNVTPTDAQGDTFALANYQLVAANFDLAQYVACDAGGGPTTITSASGGTIVAAYEVSGAAIAQCVDANNSGQGNNLGSVSTGSISTTQFNDFIFVSGAARTGGGGTTITEGNGYSTLANSGLVASALTYNSWYGIEPAIGSLSDTVSFTSAPGGEYAGILALKPRSSYTIPFWPPGATGPAFSPTPGSIGSGATVKDTCPGSATPWISLGQTPVAGATGVTVSAAELVFGSCQGNGYLTTAAAGYTVTTGFTVTNNGYVNGSGSSVTSATLSTFSTALTNPSIIFVEEYAVGTPSSFPVPTDTAGNTYVDCGPGKILYNSSAVTLECFYALNTHTTASNIVTIHASSSVTYMNGTAFEVTGGATSSPIDGGSGVGYSSLANGTGGSSGANALYGNAITPAGSGDLIIGMFAGANAIPTAGTSPNAYTAVNVSAHAVSEYFYQLVSASIDATAGSTYSGDSYGNITVALKP